MTDPTHRTLRLLSLMQGRRNWSGSALADRLGVSVRTLRRDVERLRELGYPVEAQPGVDGGYRLAAGASLPPLVLDDDEAVALTLGLQAAASGAVAGMAESSGRALAKVAPGLPARVGRRGGGVGGGYRPGPPLGGGGAGVARGGGRLGGEARAGPPLGGGRAGGRPGPAGGARAGLRGDGAAPFRLPPPRRRPRRSAGRAAPAGAARTALVPGRLRP